MESATVTTVRPMSRRRSRGLSERRLATLMVSPSVALIVLVAAYPIGYAIWMSMHEYSVRVAGLSRWAGPVGLGNYKAALSDSAFWDAVKTTFVFTGASVGLELVLGMVMALTMHMAFRGQGVLRTVILVPWAVLTVVTAIMWQTMFDPQLGFVNNLLGAVGLTNDTVWLGTEPQALIVMIVADVWKTAPFMALLILAGLQVIPDDVYEAARVDGATAWQRFTRITLPLLRPAILVALIFRTLDALRLFDLPFVLTKGAHGTETLSLLSYQTFAQNRIYGLGSALAVLTFIIVMSVSFLYIRIVGGNLRGLEDAR
ncbi:Trehalose transport system permease protein SugA [Baekduia alba]|uniref:carbohydrate ABC transporter permease n=1 Tax=Baekduia alba TaxID=2997333 RepID=UPI00233FD6B7|nr:sugar ABC transporter permease [Baekduia alba]WCB91829.1 Trehalose transport system permease protein SugA [Baekduia alba]